MLRVDLGTETLCLVESVAAEGGFLNQKTLWDWKSKVWVVDSSLPVQRVLCERGRKKSFLAENCNLSSLQGVSETDGTNSWPRAATAATAAVNCCCECYSDPAVRPTPSSLEGRGEQTWERDLLHYSSLLLLAGANAQRGQRDLVFVCCLSRLIALSTQGELCFYARPLHRLSLGQGLLWHCHFDSPPFPELTSSREQRVIGTDSSLQWTWSLARRCLTLGEQLLAVC